MQNPRYRSRGSGVGPSEAGQAEGLSQGPLEPSILSGFAYISGAMLLDLQLLGKPDAAGHADVIENRSVAAESIEEAVRMAKDIVLNTPIPGIYGFRLIRNGLEVFLWFIGQEGA